MKTEQMQIIAQAPDRREELFGLLRACLGERETARRDERFWNWKHESSPFGASLVLLGEEANQLVGLRAFLRWQWRAEGESVSAVRAVDTVTHPDHQRKGIFSRLTRAGLEAATSEGVGFVFNTPNSNSMPGYLKMGWRHVARLPMQVRVLRPLRFAYGLLRAKFFRGPTPIDARGKSFKQTPRAVDEFLAAEQGIERLIDRDAALRGSGLTTTRSPAFLRWRYANHPYVAYHVETVHEGERLRAALIWRTNTRFGLQEAMVCDILLDSPDRRLVSALVGSLRRKTDADYLIAHFGVGSAHRALLRRCGFVTLPGQGMNFTVRDLGRELSPDPFVERNWSLCLGDLEIF